MEVKTKQIEKNLDRNNTRMLHALLKKQLLYGHLPSISQSIQDEKDMQETASEVRTDT